MDFSFEKTNSAYMLFYERRLPEHLKQKHADLLASPPLKTPNRNSELAETKSASMVSQSVDSTKTIDDKDEKPQDLDSKQPIIVVAKDCNMEPQASTSAAAAAAKNLDKSNPLSSVISAATTNMQQQQATTLQFSKELEDWIWQDNRQFLQDRNIFEHTYFK